MKNKCVFCGLSLSGNKSKEHIFPRWIQERYGLSDEGLLQTHFSENGKVISDRHHSLNKHVSGRVCLNCNNGWMSELEVAAKSLITQLAESITDLYQLGSSDCFTIAKWATKTAYTLHSASNYRKIIPLGHYRHLVSDKISLPTGVWVFAFQHQCTQPFAWWQSTQWHIEAEESIITDEFLSKVKNTAYRISFSIKNLALIVVHNPFPFMQLVLLKGVHYPLCPERGPVYWYERNGFPKDDTHGACVGLMAAMGLKQKE